jgi:hypothetical protein
MAFKVKKLNKLHVQVKGEISGEDGEKVPFDFTLIAKRLNQAEIDEILGNSERKITDFLKANVEGWSGVLNEDGTEMLFSPESLESEVLSTVGMRSLCFQCYLRDVGAVAKN